MGRRIVWTLRSIARRELRRPAAARRLTDPQRLKWQAFVGPARRLHAGDFVRLLLENDAVTTPFGFRLTEPLSAAEGEACIAEALAPGPWNSPNVATYFEALATDLGRPELTATRRSKFGPIRREERILEFPSTAGRVAAAVAEPGEPLETYVTYVVADATDEFIIGLVMAEFERRAEPVIIRVDELERGDTRRLVTSFTKAATLIPNDPIATLLPSAVVGDRLIVL